MVLSVKALCHYSWIALPSSWKCMAVISTKVLILAMYLGWVGLETTDSHRQRGGWSLWCVSDLNHSIAMAIAWVCYHSLNIKSFLYVGFVLTHCGLVCNIDPWLQTWLKFESKYLLKLPFKKINLNRSLLNCRHIIWTSVYQYAMVDTPHKGQ